MRVVASSLTFAQTEEVITVTEPQVWTLIGVFAAAMASMITLTLLVVRHSIGELRAEVGQLRSEVAGELRAIHLRLDGLDRDVNALVKDRFGYDRGE